jgi:uncharacterized protein YlxP (DUF503 family)
MRVGILHVFIQIPDSQSLKDKRRVIRSLKDRLFSQFNVAVAEVGSNDKHQVGEIGIVTVANDRGFVESLLQKVVDFIEERGAEIVVLDVETEIL